MDAVAYSLASKQAQRIKKFVAEPDSVAGLVSVPNLVPIGETVTIPSGRTVVHPNLQVDGTLTVDGTLFIPSGGSVSTTEVDATVVKQNGNVVANDSTVVHKTGNETIAGVKTFSNNTIMNDGLYIGVNPTLNKLAIKQSIGTSVGGIAITASNNSATCVISEIDDGSLILRNNAIDTLKLFMGDTLHISPFGGLGYGTGAGGTVTQLTNKSTAVTLNKPCGQITMHNASLAAGASTTFAVNNSLATYTDNAIVTIVGGAGAYSNNRVQATCYTGGIAITVTNQTAGSLSEALVINFTIIKGAVA